MSQQANLFSVPTDASTDDDDKNVFQAVVIFGPKTGTVSISLNGLVGSAGADDVAAGKACAVKAVLSPSNQAAATAKLSPGASKTAAIVQVDFTGAFVNPCIAPKAKLQVQCFFRRDA